MSNLAKKAMECHEKAMTEALEFYVNRIKDLMVEAKTSPFELMETEVVQTCFMGMGVGEMRILLPIEVAVNFKSAISEEEYENLLEKVRETREVNVHLVDLTKH